MPFFGGIVPVGEGEKTALVVLWELHGYGNVVKTKLDDRTDLLRYKWHTESLVN